MPRYSGTIDSKLPHVGTTIFTVMSRLAAEHDAINLSQGFPDFDCAPELKALFIKYVNAGYNQYPPMAGIPALREAVAEKVESLYGMAYDVEHEVTIVPGATYGIYTAIAAMIRPGDEVILFEPAYDSYAPGHAHDHHQLAEQPDRERVLGGRPAHPRKSARRHRHRRRE